MFTYIQINKTKRQRDTPICKDLYTDRQIDRQTDEKISRQTYIKIDKFQTDIQKDWFREI